jgi:hypothetical protein
MLQLHNTSPFESKLFGCPDQDGIDTLIVVIKATFELSNPLRLASKQCPIVLADEYWGDPATSSLRYPNEAHLAKPGADVILNGHARAPRDQPVTQLDVVVSVGERTKLARVHGDRHWTQGSGPVHPSRPQPFVRMPLVYERAYGGRRAGTSHAGAPFEEPRNPVGVGLLVARSEAEMLGRPVPNLDDPQEPLHSLGQAPPPVGFGAVSPSWSPRATYAGTYDQRWRTTRAPFLPEDFDPRYFHAASPGLSFDHPLQGGEPVRLSGVHPDGPLHFALPRCRLDVCATVAGEFQVMNPLLDTVLFDLDEHRFYLTWRATLTVDDRLLRVERVDIDLDELEGALEPTGDAA